MKETLLRFGVGALVIVIASVIGAIICGVMWVIGSLLFTFLSPKAVLWILLGLYFTYWVGSLYRASGDDW